MTRAPFFFVTHSTEISRYRAGGSKSEGPEGMKTKSSAKVRSSHLESSSKVDIWTREG